MQSQALLRQPQLAFGELSENGLTLVTEPTLTVLARVAATTTMSGTSPSLLESSFVETINPDVFATAPWDGPNFDPQQLFSVIERSHRLFVPSRPLFGAMSVALEEVWLRLLRFPAA